MAKITYEIDVKDKGLISTLDKSSAAIKKIDKDVAKFGKSLSTSFEVFKGALAANLVSGAFNLIGKGISSTINSIGGFIQAANAQENAINRLNSALKNSGSFSEQASKDFQEFASAMQATTTFGDEVILNQLALAKSFGATNEQAKQVAQIATQLSASFGIDIESATRNAAKSLGGLAGELGEVIPEMKSLTAEQLKAGAGLDLLSAKFKGLAEGQLLTFEGATTQASNSFGDLTEELGFLITKNPVIIKAINEVTKIFQFLGKQVSDNRTTVIDFVNAFAKGFIEMIKPIALGIKGVISFGDIIRRSMFAIRGYLSLVASGWIKIAETIVSGAIKVKKALGLESGGLQNTLIALQGQFKAFNNSAMDDFDELSDTKKVDQFNDKLLETADIVENKLSKAFETSGKKVSDFKEELAGVSTTLSLGKKDQNLSKKDNSAQIEKEKKEKELKLQGELQGAGGFISSALQGADGAKAFGTQAVSLLAESFIPGLGAVAGPIANALFAGPEAVKAQIKGFTDALPDIIIALIESIPELIDALVEALPELIQALAERLPPALIEAMPKVALGLAKAQIALLPQVMGRFGQELLNGAKNFLGKIFEGAKGFVSLIARGAGDFIKNLVNGIKNALPKIGGGKKGKGLGIDLGFAKFAEGGQGFTKFVPSGFNNDTFPAKLTSGELVVDRSTSVKLKAFLDNVDKLFTPNQVMIGIQSDAEKFLTVKQNESSALGLSRAIA